MRISFEFLKNYKSGTNAIYYIKFFLVKLLRNLYQESLSRSLLKVEGNLSWSDHMRFYKFWILPLAHSVIYVLCKHVFETVV